MPRPPTPSPEPEVIPFSADKSWNATADFKDSSTAPRMERFSLLLLEPGEIYFEDFAVVLHPQKDLEKNIPGPTIKTSEASNLKSRKSTSSKEKSNILKPSSSILKEDVAIPGRLKICSKSLVFVPAFADLHRPMVKFPLNECQKIEGWAPYEVIEQSPWSLFPLCRILANFFSGSLGQRAEPLSHPRLLLR